MTTETKMIIGIAAATLLIFAGGAFFQSSAQPEVKPELLVKSDSHVIKGGDKVTLVEFADFQCEACRAAHPILQRILKDYEGKITFVLRYFPLSIHQYALLAANAAAAAGEQGKFWEMQDLLFENQPAWSGQQSSVNKDQAIEMFVSYANQLGLNTEQFRQSLTSEKFQNVIQADVADGNALGVNSTPTFFLNGKMLRGVPSYEALKSMIDEELNK